MKLEVQKRETIGTNSAKSLRRQGKVPAVLYGRLGEGGEPLHLVVDRGDVHQLLSTGDRLIELTMDGKVQQALLKEAQFDTFGMEVLHLDFLRTTDDTVVRLRVPLEFEGTPRGLLAGGITEQNRYELLVEGKASAIPSRLVVNIEHLDVGKVMHVDEIPMPDGVVPSPSLDPRSAVVSVRVMKKKGGGKKAEGEEAEAEGEAAAAAS